MAKASSFKTEAAAEVPACECTEGEYPCACENDMKPQPSEIE